MDKDFYARKMQARFNSFDFDRDGVITQADFDTMAGRMLKGFGVTSESVEGRALQDGATHFWQSLAEAADYDRDGRVTPEEFVRGATESMFGAREGFSRAAQPWASAVIAIADPDSDGRLTAADYGKMLKAIGAEDEAIKEITPYMAGNDGSVSADAVMETALDFYTSDKPYHPATWSFGRF